MPEHRTMSCARKGCFAIVTLHPDDEARLRRTHEEFYCPAGHSNYFPGKTDEQKKIEQLERWLDAANERGREWIDSYTEIREAFVRGVQVCPLGCGWHARRQLRWRQDGDDVARFLDRVGRDLTDHLISEHNATLAPVALLEAGSEA